jgi:Sigma-70, region 4
MSHEVAARQMKIICDRLHRSFHRKARRADEPPTSRDLAIFKAVAIECCTHQEVADRHQITRGRVSQIVKRVRRKLAGATPEDPHVQSYVAQQRLQTALEKLRLEHVLEITATALRKGPKILTTTRIGERGPTSEEEKDISWTESIHRDQPLNVQVVKTFLKATEALSKLNQRQLESKPIKLGDDERDLFKTIRQLLCQWRHTIDDHRDPPSPQLVNLVDQFIQAAGLWNHYRSYGVPSARAWPFVPLPACDDDDSDREALTNTSEALTNTSEALTKTAPNERSANHPEAAASAESQGGGVLPVVKLPLAPGTYGSV